MKSIQDVRAEVYRRYMDLFDFALEVVERNRAHADRWRAFDLETAVVLYHFGKGVNLLEATRRLCLHGFGREAIATSRSLLNILINLRWLTKPGLSSKRIEKFTDYEVFSRANNSMRLLQWDKEITKAEKQLHREFIRKARQVAERKGIGEGKEGRYENWHPGIKAMAKDVCLLREYHITYARLSQTEHTDPASVMEYLEDQERENRMRAVVGPTTDYALLVMIDSIRYFLNVKRDAARPLGLVENPEEVCQFDELRVKYRPMLAD